MPDPKKPILLVTPAPSHRPGFFASFAGAMGAPKTPEEAAGMTSGRYGNPWDGQGVTIGGFNPGIAFMNVVDNMGNAITDGAQAMVREPREAIHNIRAGQPILPNLGKAVSGYADFLTRVNPVVAAGTTTGEQVREGNLPGAAGSFAGGLAGGYLFHQSLQPRAPKPIKVKPKAEPVPAVPEPVEPVGVPEPEPLTALTENGETVFTGDFAQNTNADTRAQAVLRKYHPATTAHKLANAVLRPGSDMTLDWVKIQQQLDKVSDPIRAKLGDAYWELYDIAEQGVAEQHRVQAERAHVTPGQQVFARSPKFGAKTDLEFRLQYDPDSPQYRGDTRWGWGGLEPYRQGIGKPWNIEEAIPDPVLVKKMTRQEIQNSENAAINAFLYRNRFEVPKAGEVQLVNPQDWKPVSQAEANSLADQAMRTMPPDFAAGVTDVQQVVPPDMRPVSNPSPAELNALLDSLPPSDPRVQILPDRMQVWGQHEPMTLEQLRAQEQAVKTQIDNWFRKLPRQQQLDIAGVKLVEPDTTPLPEAELNAISEAALRLMEQRSGTRYVPGSVQVVTPKW